VTGDRSAAQRLMQNPALAAVYERAWRPFLGWSLMGFDLEHLRREHQLTIDALRLTDGDVVLDVACGPGNFTAALAEAVEPSGQAIGLDSSEPMLARARRDNLHPHAAYLLGDAHHLPFRDGALDAVNCYAALYLIPDPYAAFAELLRVLRAGGRISVMTSLASSRQWLRPVQARALGLTGLTMFDRGDFTSRLRAAGFTEVSQEIHGLAQYVSATAPG
jgi:ubiquinone/menaquinone biosynthesis C-methylase UbiE